jgi:cytochrome P450
MALMRDGRLAEQRAARDTARRRAYIEPRPSRFKEITGDRRQSAASAGSARPLAGRQPAGVRPRPPRLPCRLRAGLWRRRPFPFGTQTRLLLNRPDLVEQVLVDRQGTFIKHSFFWRHARRLFGEGLLTSEGEHWRRQHRLIAPAFQQEQLERYAPVVVERAETMLRGWRSGESRDLLPEMGRLTLGIVARVLFDLELAHDVDRLGRAVDRGVEALAQRFQSLIVFPEWLPTPANRAFLSSIREFDALIAAMIQARRQHGGSASEDLLSRMMRAHDDEGRPMGDRQLRDEAVTLLLAGHETTAVALAWTCWLLARHPETAAQAAGEADAVLGDSTAEAADLPQLRFCTMIINEALRLYPPAYVVGRETVRACRIGGYPIPTGATLFMSQWVMHRDPRYFQHPEAFIPERWGKENVERLPRFAFFPFGGGRASASAAASQ